jgi:hypothetical protein
MEKINNEKAPYILANNVILDAREVAGVRYSSQGVYLVEFIDGQQVFLNLDNIDIEIIDRVIKDRIEALKKEKEER